MYDIGIPIANFVEKCKMSTKCNACEGSGKIYENF